MNRKTQQDAGYGHVQDIANTVVSNSVAVSACLLGLAAISLFGFFGLDPLKQAKSQERR